MDFLENGRNQKRHKQNRNTLRKVSESGNDDGRLVEVIDESFDKRELVDLLACQLCAVNNYEKNL